MTAPGRDQAIQTLEEGCTAIQALLAGRDEADLVRPRTIGGGDWSAKDLLGHIAFWEELAVQALASAQEGAVPDVEAVFGAGAAGVDAANAENFRRTSAQSFDEVRSRHTAAHDAILAAVKEMSDEEWRTKVAYPGERRRTPAELLGSVLGAPKRPFGHAFAHLADLEAFAATL